MMTDVLQRYRVVLDTNQIVAAGSRWTEHTPPVATTDAQKLVYAAAFTHVGLFSGEIATEYVLKLSEKGHSKERIQRYMGLLLGAFEKVNVSTTECSPAPDDRDDVVFLLCAIDGKAHLLITEDRHLLAVKEGYPQFQIVKGREAALTLGCVSA